MHRCGGEPMKSIKTILAHKTMVGLIAAAGLVGVTTFAHAADKKDCEPSEHHQHSDAMDDDGGMSFGHMQHRMGGGHASFTRILDLTEAQKKTLESSRAAQEASMHELHEKLRTAHEALDKADDSNADDATLNKLSGNLASLIAQQEVARIKAHRQLVSILTPEQKQKLTEFEAEHKKDLRWKGKQEKANSIQDK